MNKEDTQKSDIDLIDLFRSLWSRKTLIIRVTLLFSVIGITIGYISPNVFTASSTFIPQVVEKSTSGSLSSLASLAGVNINTSGSESGIPATLYPKISNSVPFLMEVLESEVNVGEEPFLYKEYLAGKRDVWGVIKKYTIDLPKTIFSNSDEDDKAQTQMVYDELLSISDEDFKVMKTLSRSLSIETNEKEGYVTISVRDESPSVAAQITLQAQKILQSHVISYKIEKAKILLAFTEEQWQEKQTEFYDIQDKLSEFNETNQSISSAYLENERLRLEARYDVANAIYTELTKQKEEAALKVEKDTPIFSIIDPVVVPKERTSPKRKLLLMIFGILGLLVSSVYVLSKERFVAFKKDLMGKESKDEE